MDKEERLEELRELLESYEEELEDIKNGDREGCLEQDIELLKKRIKDIEN